MPDEERLIRYWVSQERTVYPHNFFRKAAKIQLELAEEKESGRFYTCMMAAMACAFAIEAFLNYVGSDKVEHWDILERLRPHEKLAILSTKIGLEVDLGSRPFQTFSFLFRFRSAIAHGKVETVSAEGYQTLGPTDSIDRAQVEWEKFVELENVRRVVEDAEAMIKKIADAANLSVWALASMAEGSHTRSRASETDEDT